MISKASSLMMASIVAITTFAVPAEAAGTKKGATAGGAELPASTMAPLTASECERLGGTVLPNPNCKTTKESCTVSTLNNQVHTVCTTEVK